MTKQELQELLSGYGCSEIGTISLTGDRVGFSLAQTLEASGHVYLWVEIGDTAEVVYVGKAGRTLQARCNQHANGFRNSKTGQAHSARLREGLASGRRYLVYARKSGVASIFGEAAIPLEAVEELALIKKFKPKWNAQS